MQCLRSSHSNIGCVNSVIRETDAEREAAGAEVAEAEVVEPERHVVMCNAMVALYSTCHYK